MERPYEDGVLEDYLYYKWQWGNHNPIIKQKKHKSDVLMLMICQQCGMFSLFTPILFECVWTRYFVNDSILERCLEID